MSSYSVDGYINISVVDGTTYTGFNAPDGSMYVVESDGSDYVGISHPCGATWVTLRDDNTTFFGRQAPDGSLNITTLGYLNGALRVEVVSGSLGAVDPGDQLLLTDSSFVLLTDGSTILLS